VIDPALVYWCEMQAHAYDQLPEPVRKAIAEDPNQLDSTYFLDFMWDLRRRHPRSREKTRIRRLLDEVAAVSKLAHEHHERVMAEALGR